MKHCQALAKHSWLGRQLPGASKPEFQACWIGCAVDAVRQQAIPAHDL